MDIDVIIIDFHEPIKKPPSTIVVNPKQEGCNYPFKELSTCGMALS